MNKEFIPYKIALELKELGFDEPCFTFYPKEGKMGFDGKYHSIKEGYKNSTVNDIWIKRYKKDFECVAAPTYSQCFRWFREKYDIVSFVKRDYKDATAIGFYFGIDTLSHFNFIDFYSNSYKTYEEAELACLRKLIEIVKTK
jgi:hypothetical protein